MHGEPERTAGIIPSSFRSSKYGQVTAYDFAGQREYYAGHEAVMQSIVQKIPPIVIIHVKLTAPRDRIIKAIQYWSCFMRNRLKGLKSQLIIVCSHADQVYDNRLKLVSESIESVLSTNSEFQLIRIIGMDCRKWESQEMSLLVSLLVESTNALRQKGVASFKAHCLYVFLMQHLRGKRLFITMNELFHLQRTMCVQMQAQSLLFRDFQEVKGLCEELASNGQILLLRDSIAHKCLILLHSEKLLNEISGKILAPEDFPDHENISSITGVVPLTKMKLLFPQYDPKLIFKYLCSIEYCFEVHDKIVLEYILQQKDISPSENYYFFPGLVTEKYPDNLELWEECRSAKFCWVLRCSDDEFFSPKFIQILLLRLVFGCTRVEKNASKLWKSGLYWYSGDGIKTFVNVIDTSKVIVLMQCKPEDCFELLRDRSTYLNQVRELQREICPSLHCEEFFIHHSHVKKYFESTESKHLVPMKEVCSAIRSKKKYALTSHTIFEIQELILFDPYTYLCANLLKTILNGEYCTRKIPVKFMELLNEHLHEVPSSHIFGTSNSLGRLMSLYQRKGSNFGNLRRIFDRISTFATCSGE